MSPTSSLSGQNLAAHAPVRGIERGAYLIIATPVLTLLSELESRLALARSYDPNGAMRHTLETVVGDLRAAVTRAEATEVWGTLQELAERYGRAITTVTDWAPKYGDGVWCWKKSGVWAVDILKFDAWYRTNEPMLNMRRKGPKSATEPVDAKQPETEVARAA